MEIFKLFVIVTISAAVAGFGEIRAIRSTPASVPRDLYSEPTKAIPGPEKNYTGIRLNANAMLLVYYCEQTIAVVEVGSDRQLFNCELMEVKTKPDRDVALASLKAFTKSEISIGLDDMLDLMLQCQKLDFPMEMNMNTNDGIDRYSGWQTADNFRFRNGKELSSIFSGVFPGTKWCGTGDLAMTYYELGTDTELDKCCRTHDHCPVKVAGFKTQYDITNYSLYSKSHCKCDALFYECLKAIDSATSNFLGTIFFNVLKAMCVEDAEPDSSMKVGKKFSWRKKRY